MTEFNKSYCPLCHQTLKRQPQQQACTAYFDCVKCGHFGLDIAIFQNNILTVSGRITSRILINIPKLTQAWDPQKTTIINEIDISKYQTTHSEPKALEILENLLSFYCENGAVGQEFRQNQLELAVASNTLSFDTAEWGINQANAMGWLDTFDARKDQSGYIDATFKISAKGWANYYENQKNGTSGNQAFLALQFNNETLRNIIVPVLKSACKKAGFVLQAVNENRKAGLIDNKIRVDIRNSKFLVVDISDQNQGAYFEAGFAEGLGKPVFYICDKSVFDKHHKIEGREKTVHFDIEHHDIITWDASNPSEIEDELLASIRNTLSNDAKMAD